MKQRPGGEAAGFRGGPLALQAGARDLPGETGQRSHQHPPGPRESRVSGGAAFSFPLAQVVLLCSKRNHSRLLRKCPWHRKAGTENARLAPDLFSQLLRGSCGGRARPSGRPGKLLQPSTAGPGDMSLPGPGLLPRPPSALTPVLLRGQSRAAWSEELGTGCRPSRARQAASPLNTRLWAEMGAQW